MSKITLDVAKLLESGKSLDDIIDDVAVTIEKEYEKAEEAKKKKDAAAAALDTLKEDYINYKTLCGAAPTESEISAFEEYVKGKTFTYEDSFKKAFDKLFY